VGLKLIAKSRTFSSQCQGQNCDSDQIYVERCEESDEYRKGEMVE